MTPALHTWAERWQIPPACLAELLVVMGAGAPLDPCVAGLTSEAAVQQAVRLEAARQGSRLWRNNVGVAMGENGVPIRFGLANDSAATNAVCKSSDLIGITPTICDCGRRWGVFTALECKRKGWVFRPSDKHSVAQLNYLQLVVSLGGIGKFITKVEDL